MYFFHIINNFNYKKNNKISKLYKKNNIKNNYKK